MTNASNRSILDPNMVYGVFTGVILTHRARQAFFEHAQNALIQIIQRMRKVSSVHLLTIDNSIVSNYHHENIPI